MNRAFIAYSAILVWLMAQTLLAAQPLAEKNRNYLLTPALSMNLARGESLANPPESGAFAAAKGSSAASGSIMQDVALQKGGVFMGRLVDRSGSAIAAARVLLLHKNKLVAKTQTDQQGNFTFRDLRGGIYQLSAPDTQRIYRLWAAGTAPKSAAELAYVVAGQTTMRGQTVGHRARKWLRSPVGLAAIVGTAVAVPVALHNSGCDSAD